MVGVPHPVGASAGTAVTVGLQVSVRAVELNVQLQALEGSTI